MSESVLSQAQQLQQQGDLVGALRLLDAALLETPQAPDLLYFRAHLAIKLQDWPRAAQDLDTLLINNPDNPQVLDDRGVLYQMQGDFYTAADFHLRAAEKSPASDTILFNLATALNHLGQKQQAGALYHDVLQINPRHTRALVNLGILADEVGRYEEAVNYLARAVNLGDTSFEACMALGNVSRHLEQKDQALVWYGRAVAQQPRNESAQFMLAAARGDTPDVPPPSHIAGLFDSYAETFETSLRDKLKYNAPEKLIEMAAPLIVEMKAYYNTLSAVDLGAGTGLMGKLLRPHVTTNIAVDLSAKMLEKARATGAYDQLVVGDAVEVLNQLPEAKQHLLAAADVLVYMGNLEKLFTAARRALVTNGLFLFTAESLLPEEAPPFVLRDTGRYAHAQSYIEQLLQANGLAIRIREHDFLRLNKNTPLSGFYYIVQKY